LAAGLHLDPLGKLTGYSAPSNPLAGSRQCPSPGRGRKGKGRGKGEEREKGGHEPNFESRFGG